MVDARGAAYDPTPPPQSGGAPAMVQFLQRELGRIASAIKLGRSQFLSLDVQQTLPSKPFAGQVQFFGAGVAGTDEGLYEFRGATGSWHKL